MILQEHLRNRMVGLLLCEILWLLFLVTAAVNDGGGGCELCKQFGKYQLSVLSFRQPSSLDECLCSGLIVLNGWRH